VPAKQSRDGVTPPTNEGQTNHYDRKSKGGSSDASNAVHACRACDLEQGATLPDGTKFDKKKAMPNVKTGNN
jgi:hypothetical protein